jgi:outer membrane protein OmpA-like peptidoglycan-associated protein
MDEQDELGIPLAVVFFVIALVIALVIGLGVWKLNRSTTVPVVEALPTPVDQIVMHGEPAATTDAASVEYTDIAPVGDAQLKVYFAVGQTDLSDEARTNIAALARVINEMGANVNVVLVSGFHDETGTAQVNADVAKQRALSVRDAFVGEGVDATLLQLRKPEVTLGDGDPAEARRVEVRIQ